MYYEANIDIKYCDLCKEKAEVFYIKKTIFSLRFKTFCKDCSIKHKLVKK